MTSVLRVKRRIDEDPVEALIVSCKRFRHIEDQNLEKSIFSFAGTISSKDEPVSRHIKEAIRKTKLHQHNKDFRHTHHRPQSINDIRLQKEQASKASRFRVTCSKRALDLELLDKDLNTASADVDVAGAVGELCRDSLEHKCPEVDKENNKDDGKIKCDKDNCKIDKSSILNPTTKVLCSKNTHILPKHEAGEGDKCSSDKENVICMYDVENEEEDDLLNAKIQECSSGITLNNVSLVTKRVMSPPKSESQFVYDLYYTHHDLSHFDPEAVLTVEALCEEYVNDENHGRVDHEFDNNESDDSNDENNWRNDYPDEDPHFFENEDTEYGYAEDMVETNFLCEDDSDLLTYWMSTRCRVSADGESDNGEDEYEDDHQDDCASSDET